MNKRVPLRKKESETIRQPMVEVEYVELTRLTPWGKNPRRNDMAADKLASLIEKYGFVDPIIATRDGVIRAGDTRYKSAQKAGLKRVPVIWKDFESEEQAELFSIAHNKSHEWAEWDPERLRNIISELRASDITVSEEQTGFTSLELEGLQIPSEEQSSLPGLPKVQQFREKRNEYWLFFVTPSKEAFQAILDRFGLSDPDVPGSKRQLDWKKVRRLFMEITVGRKMV